jgi:hypothetical protein
VAIATNVQKETLSTAYGAAGTYISVHTADPVSTYQFEITPGSGGYARVATSWTPGGSDGVNSGGQVTINVPAGTYTHIGLGTAVTAGTFLDRYQLPTAQTFATAGQLLVTPTFTIT